MCIILSNLKYIIKMSIANSFYRNKKESLKNGTFIYIYLYI